MSTSFTVPTKEDLCGLAQTGLVVSDNGDGKSAQFIEKVGANGDIVAYSVFGTTGAASCSYAITADISNFSKNIGQVYKSGSAQALKSFTVGTSAGGTPTFSANCVQIEAGATRTVCVYATTPISVTPECHAQNFGAFSFTESAALSMQECTYTAEADINVKTVNGTPVASDATGGKETVTATFWSVSDEAPTITDSTGWVRSSPLTCTGSDGDVYTFTATWTKHLTSAKASA